MKTRYESLLEREVLIAARDARKLSESLWFLWKVLSENANGASVSFMERDAPDAEIKQDRPGGPVKS